MDASAVRRGFVIQYEGQLYQVVEWAHYKPGKGHAFLQAKLRNLEGGGIVEKRFRTSEKMEVV